jgi:hypothetical protein
MRLKDIGATGAKRKGLSKSPLYGIWSLMLYRCYDKNSKSYINYGKRGITVCNRWFCFDNFHDDNIKLYNYGLEIDRTDNNGDYSPGNTRWVTHSQNCRNRRTSVLATINGVEKSVYDWADEAGINPKMVLERVQQQGWSIERALSEPTANRHENMLIAQGKRWEGHVKVPKRKPKTARKIRTIEYKGETMTIKQLSDIVGVSAKLLSKRLFERGWPLDRAVTNENFKGTNQFTKEQSCKSQQ